jgi:hypothetical protein
MHIMHNKIDLHQTKNMLLMNMLRHLHNQDIIKHYSLIFKSFIGSFGLSILDSEQENLKQHTVKDDKDDLDKTTRDEFENKDKVIRP